MEVVASEENILKILVATDTHLGYAEKNSIRGNNWVISVYVVQLIVCNQFYRARFV